MMTLLQGDCTEVLPTIAAGSVQTIVTSPPYYGLRDYGLPPTAWPAVEYTPLAGLPGVTVPAMSCCLGLESDPIAYVAHLVYVWRELRRVLRDDGVVFLNLGDSYAGSSAVGFRPGCGRADGKVDERGQRNRNGTGAIAGLKPKDLLMIPARVALALQADGWYLRSDVIWHKCLSGGAVVYTKTQKGEMPMMVRDMVRLDPATVQLWDGNKWNQCIEWHAVDGDPDRKAKSSRARRARYAGREPTIEGDIEIELRSGERIGCTREHRWPTQRGLLQANELLIGDTIHSCLLPEPEQCRRPAALDDDLVGWFVGLYIAEGSRHDGTIHISSHQKERERFDRLHILADAFDGHCSINIQDGNSAVAILNGPMVDALIDTYVSGRTAKDKHLSPRCWKRSNRFLRAVMEGYLSGDGGNNGDGRWRLGFCDNDTLAIDLRVLSARIGGSIRLRRYDHTFDGRIFPGWLGSFYFDPTRRRRPDSEIVAIRQSRARAFYDIVLESDPHLFSLGSGVLTHNSNPMPESVTDRPTKAHEYVFLLAKSERYFYDAEAIREAATATPRPETSRNGEGSKARSSSGNGASDRTNLGYNRPELGRNRRTVWLVAARYFRRIRRPGIRSVWSIATQPYSGAHFAVMPEALIRPCILAGSAAQACERCGAP